MIVNKILRNLNNNREIASFIDDIIIETEEEEEHNEVVGEIVKRLEENNLYMKPENFIWKVKEISRR